MVVTSMSVSVAMSSFCVPEARMGGASTALTAAVVFTVCETFDALFCPIVFFISFLSHFAG